MYDLRPYQTDAINSTRKSFLLGKTSPLVVLPCGAGKTMCFSYMAEQNIKKSLSRGVTPCVWFLVHRQELVDQTISTIKSVCEPEIIKYIVVAMVQTVSRHLSEYPAPSLIIFDEAHHSTAATWRHIIDTYPRVIRVGLTATPCRRDGTPLKNIYDDLIIGVDSEYLIRNKYLSEYDYYAPNINIMLPKITRGDYDPNIDYESRIYGNVLNYIDCTKKTIIYCPNINFSFSLAADINSKFGDISVHFDGNTPNRERERIISEFRSGSIRVLLNVDLIGEGFDVPDCDCVMLLRPTLSLSLYIQQSMRCLRYQKNKRAVIYDFVGNCHRHGLPTENREWSLTSTIRVKNPSSEPNITCRECGGCHLVYKGTDPICPYCGFDNKKTRKQIEMEQAELERIESINKRKQIGMTRSLDGLIEIAKKRGYKNPVYWAKCVMNGRRKKV